MWVDGAVCCEVVILAKVGLMEIRYRAKKKKEQWEKLQKRVVIRRSV
jgi:hypothetical protein